jgi:hypothetical protein
MSCTRTKCPISWRLTFDSVVTDVGLLTDFANAVEQLDDRVGRLGLPLPEESCVEALSLLDKAYVPWTFVFRQLDKISPPMVPRYLSSNFVS